MRFDYRYPALAGCLLFLAGCVTPLPAPGAVTMSRPDPGAVVRSAAVTFAWTGSGDAAAYQLQVGSKSGFSSTLYDEVCAAETAVVRLGADGRYYWRVRPISPDSVPGDWSEVRSLDLTRFAIVASAPAQGYAHDVVLQGDRAYLAQGQAGLAVYDITDPESPVLLGAKMDSLNEAWGVAVRDSIAYVAYGYKELVVMNVARPESIRVTGVLEYPQPGYGYGVALSDSHAFVAANAQFLKVEAADPRYPNLVYQGYYPRDCRAVAVRGGAAFVAVGQLGIAAWDITVHPPRQVGAMDTPGYARGIAVQGDVVCVADGREGLVVVDVSAPDSPRLVSRLALSGYANSVVLEDTLVFVGCGDGGLSVVSVARPDAPVLVARIPLGYCMGVSARDGYAFVGDRDQGLVVIRQED